MNCLKRHTCCQSKRFYWKGHREESRRAGNPGELLHHVVHSVWFYGDGTSFRVVFSPSFWLRVLPGGAGLIQPRWMPVRRILGGGQTCGVSFWPFPNSSGGWWLISSVFLTRTTCRKTTHANGDYGSWPGWAVSASAPPLTSLHTSSSGGVILQYNLIPTTRSQLRLHELRAQSPTRLPSVQTTAAKFRIPRLPAFWPTGFPQLPQVQLFRITHRIQESASLMIKILSQRIQLPRPDKYKDA